MMGSTFQWFVAKRLLFSLKGQRFLAVLTLFSVVLVMGTVALAYAVSCISESFSLDLRNKLLRAHPHVEVALEKELSADEVTRLEADPSVKAVTPAVTGSALLELPASEGEDKAQGVMVWGVDPHHLGLFAGWPCRGPDGIREDPRDDHGRMREAVSVQPAGILFGSELFGDVGGLSEVKLLYPFADVDPFGNAVPVQATFRVRGACESGVYPIDRKLVVISADAARGLLGEYHPTWNRLWISLKDPFEAPTFIARWGAELGRFGAVTSWETSNRTILGALAAERKVFGGVVLLVFALASMSLYGMLSLHVIEKSADFAVLSTLGIRSRDVVGIILKMSTVLAGFGAGLGSGLGFVLVALLGHYPLPLPEAYYLRELFVDQDLFYLALIALLSAGVQVGASLVPALWLTRMRPVEILRFVEGGIV